MNKLKIAIIQAAPIYFQRKASLKRAAEFTQKAAADGANLVVFPETWLSGYPVWLDEAAGAALWDQPGAHDLYRAAVNSAYQIDGPGHRELAKLATKHGLYIVMGAHELYGKSLYNSQLLVGPAKTKKGEGHFFIHRKLIPTYTERLMWGRGDGSTIGTIKMGWDGEGPAARLGGLICWEHWMPLARAAMHHFHEDIHVAQWPAVGEMHEIASRAYAFEARCFVAASGTIVRKRDLVEGYKGCGDTTEAGLALLESMPGSPNRLFKDGGSSVIAPDGSFVTKPNYTDEMIMAEVDISECTRQRMTLDPDGHYSRPDVFQLNIDTREKRNVEYRHPDDE